MFILERLVSRSSRSLAVMIGFARNAKAGGREGLRGSPDDFPFLPPAGPRSSPSRRTSRNPR
jgi:hypothetical protein